MTQRVERTPSSLVRVSSREYSGATLRMIFSLVVNTLSCPLQDPFVFVKFEMLVEKEPILGALYLTQSRCALNILQSIRHQPFQLFHPPLHQKEVTAPYLRYLQTGLNQPQAVNLSQNFFISFNV